MEKNKDNRLVIIVKIEKYIEYMLTILLKLPRTEKIILFELKLEQELLEYSLINSNLSCYQLYIEN